MRAKTAKKPVELRPLDEVLADIRKTFGHKDIQGVTGYAICVKGARARLRLSWGNIRSPKVH